MLWPTDGFLIAFCAFSYPSCERLGEKERTRATVGYNIKDPTSDEVGMKKNVNPNRRV